MNTHPELIVMLTYNDVTVPQAAEVFAKCEHTRARYWGFKEAGLPFAEMRDLFARMKACGKQTCLEVVAYTEAECLRGAEMAAACGCDFLLGTVFSEAVNAYCRAHGLWYMPFVGQVTGRPSVLEGTAEEMVCEAKRCLAQGAYGIDLLGYRYTGDAPALNRALTAAVKSGDSIAKRLIAAGVFTESTWNEVKDMTTDTPTDTPAAPENPETKITPIAELNLGGTDGDHMADDYNTATVEADFRTKVLLNSAKTGYFRYDSAFYPRVKKVRDDLYLLLYHFTQTGQHLYYATSRDGVHWNAPEVLYNRVDHNFVYESGERAGQTDGYYAVNADAVVLQSGEILCAYSVRPFNGYETYIDLNGIDLIRGRATEDGKIEWSAPTRIYTGQNWEASFLKHDDGRIELYFTQIAPYISKYGYDKSYRSSGTGMLVSTDNGYTWTPNIQPGDKNDYRATTVFQQLVGTRNDLPYFCGQMPVAVSLANGKTMLAVEIRRLLQQNYDVSYALSGEGGVWRALDLTEEGPDTTKVNYISGAASPYLARFDSGEVVMTYAAGNRLLARLGAPDGSGFSNTSFSILPDAPGFWGSVERVGSHAMLFVNQATSQDGATSGIAMIRGYLNHRINAPKRTMRVDGYTNGWEDNTDAFFVGSETQAQVTLRTAHDDENLYFLVSRLDEFITDRDTATVCIAAGTASDYRITVGLDGIRSIEYYQNGAKQATLTGGTAAVRVRGTPNDNADRDEGFVVEFSIPKALVGMTGKKSFKARLALVNGDGKGETADSMSVSLYSTAKWPAVVLDD